MAQLLRQQVGYMGKILLLQRHMIMNYPEYSSVTSRHGYPKLAISAAFGVHDVPWLADCISDGTGLPRMPDDRPASLKKLFGSTNMIESCYSVAGDLCRNVKRWRGESMAKRWAGVMLLETERRFYRIRGHREMPMLVAALKRNIDTKEAIA